MPTDRTSSDNLSTFDNISDIVKKEKKKKKKKMFFLGTVIKVCLVSNKKNPISVRLKQQQLEQRRDGKKLNMLVVSKMTQTYPIHLKNSKQHTKKAKTLHLELTTSHTL